MNSTLQRHGRTRSTQAREYVARLFRSYKLPTILIIGAQKGGTTSLASYLSAHPNVVSPKRKEVHFFDLNYEKGVDWYRSQFPVGARRRLGSEWVRQPLLACDATPYYLLHPQVPGRVSHLLPNARIIILLRSPVDRAYSQYHHEVRLGHEHLTFEKAIEAEDSRIAGEAERLRSQPLCESFNYQHFAYLERGKYLEQIRQWLDYFQPNRFLVLSSERFFENPALEYRRVLTFLDLPAWELRRYPAEHVGKYPPMSKHIRTRLVEYYAPYNRDLRLCLNSRWSGVGDAIVDRFDA